MSSRDPSMELPDLCRMGELHTPENKSDTRKTPNTHVLNKGKSKKGPQDYNYEQNPPAIQALINFEQKMNLGIN